MKKAKAGVSFRDVLKENLKDPEFKKAFEEADLPARLAIQIAKARERAHLTQAQLARRIGTKQQAISRVESGDNNITIEFLQRIANATGTNAEVFLR